MRISFTLILLFLIVCLRTVAQISPGPLAEPHTHLEGISNCTNCHDLGNKVTNAKCLACHTEIKARIDIQKGYHSSPAVKGKDCSLCHNDHHGTKFKIVKFDQTKFNHTITGFTLTGKHAKKLCNDCHKPQFISKPDIKKKKFTFLGLDQKCALCHADYHQKTLSLICSDCHDFEAFKPASKFDHTKAKFKLIGKHQEVECIKCHKTETREGKKFQNFTGLKFNACSDCHTDVHHKQFGTNCSQCHTETSFKTIKQTGGFDHDKTDFKLEGKHKNVACNLCHKTKVTDPVKHDKCYNCHKDYHDNQFTNLGVPQDCIKCHTNNGFQGSTFTIEQHNNYKFMLQGSHVATPCLACHKKQEKWSFRNIGIHCYDCHTNIHERYLNIKFYPDSSCENCHDQSRWSNVTFDHSKTNFKLNGTHAKQNCKACHFKKDSKGQEVQKFSAMTMDCYQCHTDAHYGQFSRTETCDCEKCHGFEKWPVLKFDHNLASFKLDGKHETVACAKCHKKVTIDQKTYVQYKIKDVTCKTCH